MSQLSKEVRRLCGLPDFSIWLGAGNGREGYWIDKSKRDGTALGLKEDGWVWIRGYRCRGIWSTKSTDVALATHRRLHCELVKHPMNGVGTAIPKAPAGGDVGDLCEAFWDCDCEENYITPASQTECPKCGAKGGDDGYPDSRVKEVKAAFPFLTDRDLIGLNFFMAGVSHVGYPIAGEAIPCTM